MKLAIGAIFRDEFDYIIEWLAWHEMAGFSTFYIADNCSTDGTRELLEALSDLGKITLIYQPIVEKQVQIRAYNRIAQLSIAEADAVLFIDADEFLTHDSMKDGAEYQCLSNLLKDDEVGLVAVNWRCFGSSGLEIQDNRPVIERFNQCASDLGQNPNQFLKSISKISHLKNINPHSALVTDKKYIKSHKEEIRDFILLIKNEFQPVAHSGRTRTITSGPLRVNHYVIKSKQEYIEKKEKRGDVMLGVNHERGMAYFKNHDFKDQTFNFPLEKIKKIKSRITEINNNLKTTFFSRKIKGSLDINNQGGLQGWLVDENGESKGLKVNIFVNGIHQGFAQCGFYRPDLKEKNISTDGMSGFRYTHPAPLKPGDIVEVKVHANRYQFPQRARTVIE